jgi:hypothetical protein
MDDVQPRQLLKQLGTGALVATIETDPFNPTIQVAGGNWESILQTPNGSVVAIANRTYIDLAGYTQQDLTTFIQSVDIQERGLPSYSTAGGTIPVNLVWVYDFITTRRITTAELSQLTTDIPGYLPSTLDLMEMIYGEHKQYAVNTQVPGTYITVNGDTLGSGNPSAADRLHWTRVLLCYPDGDVGENAVVGCTEANLVCQAVTGKEKDLVYIERLRRAYTQERTES